VTAYFYIQTANFVVAFRCVVSIQICAAQFFNYLEKFMKPTTQNGMQIKNDSYVIEHSKSKPTNQGSQSPTLPISEIRVLGDAYAKDSTWPNSAG
jgi:hypothetical protein